MRRGRLGLFLGLALALCACGKQQAAGDHAGAAAPNGESSAASNAARSAAANPAHAPAPQQKPADAGSDQPSKITRINEDGSETVEEVSSDSGAHNPLLAAVASTVAAGSSAAAAATPNGPLLWQEGVHYTRLVPAQPTAVPAGQIEVLEFFWYACPHCYAIDPLVETWRKSKPAYVSFARVPVLWNEGHRSLARLYYTLESLGKIDQLHGEIFKEIHVNGNPLIGSDPGNDAESQRVQTIFVRKFGIADKDFAANYHSMFVDTALGRADQLVQRYRIDAVPKFVINGKYIADVSTAGSPEKLIALIDYLTAQEHKR
jgi:thiol:disulfide interchange protein DsbA